MVTLKYFFTIALAQKYSSLMYIGIFVILSFVFMQAPPEGDMDFSSISLNISIIDQDNSLLSRGLTNHLGSFHTLVDIENTEEALQNALFTQRTQYILFIPADFENAFLQNPATANLTHASHQQLILGFYVDRQISDFLTTIATYLAIDINIEYAVSYTILDLNQTENVTMLQPPATNNLGVFYQFLAYTLLSVVMNIMGPIFVTLNKAPLAKRIDMSSQHFKSRSIQMFIGGIIVAIVIWAIFTGLGIGFNHFIFGEEVSTHIQTFRIVNSLALLISSVSIGFLIGNISKSKNALGGAVQIIGLGSAFLTGVFVNQEVLGDAVLAIGRFLPQYWYVRSNNMLSNAATLSQGQTHMFWQSIAIQLAFAVALFIITFVVKKQKYA